MIPNIPDKAFPIVVVLSGKHQVLLVLTQIFYRQILYILVCINL